MAKKVKVVERKLGWWNAYGFAHIGEDLIEIDPRQTTKSYMETLIHEQMHLLFPDLSERQITIKSKKLTKLLWDMNYRRVALK